MSIIVNKAVLFPWLTPVSQSCSILNLPLCSGRGAQPGHTDPGCMSGREEPVLVVAEDREERLRGEKEEKTLAF